MKNSTGASRKGRTASRCAMHQVLASTWLCAPRRTASDESPRRHQDLAEALVSGAPKAAAEAMRRHIDNALKNTLQRLDSYFQMREANRTTFARSLKKQARLAQLEDRGSRIEDRG
jgi:hypothetical protein